VSQGLHSNRETLMNTFIPHLKMGHYHGKGIKFSKKGDFFKAITYFERALENAKKCGNPAMIPFELEAIAHSYFMLEEYKKAEKFTIESLKMYNELLNEGTIIKDSIERVNSMLTLIREKGV